MQARENLAQQAAKSAAEALIPQANDKQKWWQQITEYSLIVIFVVMFITMSLTVDHFFSIENMLGLALSISQIGMVACTMMFCLASRDFDLSIGSTVAFAGVLCAMVLNATGNTFIAIVAAVVAGSVIGFVNGAVIAYLRINALITTLATMEIVRGLGFIVSHGQAVGVSSDTFIALGGLSMFGVSLPIWVTLVCFIVFGVMLNSTVYGRNTLAIGGNPEASRLAGINVERTRVYIFLIQGAVTALAGVILASRITSGQPNAAEGFELNVISACVLGGVSLLGGRATISGVVIGVLIMGTVENVMNLMNIDAFYQYLVRGAILLAAVLLDQLKNRGSRD
ncbi:MULTISPECIES: L-arabinose ABC transporter permease AraH [Paraburkholderia]|jgi:L-arabinose transport system permease protein|uniref:L-arabinose ABC transporter permease AraH n=1 Tax=Paraburkholderia largidicola TaxID=3014751 RepID=A0A7I8BNK1_9BURK|nr:MULTISPECIES: L-arabinose ABC transporter permease AraH [Paraburkholderia]BEU22655.1 L-arabinose ABC transporter permease AraH [Paraburkholderia sp. 22B1P]GJH37548.1 L-arabinose ABC transporter permease AraH [Paraburkholderia hospita]CAG9267056.1 arabinose ABC transporter membrane subunit [Paraburkholderia caribensis]BCF89690.1 L-arabinose ABC transporter permease AraH [Paraburkholderia sp. PGU16]GJH06729.1 L-arabinose ABC transporter permease AraH [Paraburkholderia terrae]